MAAVAGAWRATEHAAQGVGASAPTLPPQPCNKTYLLLALVRLLPKLLLVPLPAEVHIVHALGVGLATHGGGGSGAGGRQQVEHSACCCYPSAFLGVLSEFQTRYTGI